MDTEKEWWKKPVRMLRVDYAPDFSKVKEEDLEQLARSRKENWQITCEWIVGTPGFTGGGYRTTFKADGYEPCPGFEDFDYLRRYTPYAHTYGIHVVSYLNMHWYPYDFAERHPGWEQITSSGESYGRVHPLYGNGTTFCVNSPWRDWAFGLVREAMKTGIDGVFLDGPVVYPDCCYCPACREKFRRTYGESIPKEDWQSPTWKRFLEFREDSLAQFLADAQREVCTVNPDGVIFLNAGSWHPGGWRVARDIQKVGPFQNFNGAEAFFHYGKDQNIYASLMTGKYLRAGERPAIVFTHYMNGLWHYLNLPPGEVRLALVQTAAAGANPWLALINSSLASQPESSRPVQGIFGFLEEKKEYFCETESLAEVGLLFSSQTGRNYLSRFEGFYERSRAGREEHLNVDRRAEKVVDWSARKRQCEGLLTSSCAGYFHALTRAHIPFDILLDQNLTGEKLSHYRTLLLPDVACMGEAAALAIREFVRNGGNLLASYEAGLYDDQGNFTDVLLDLLGVEDVTGLFPVVMGENYLRVTKDHLGFREGSLIERGAYVMKVRAGENAEVPALFLEPMMGVYTPLTGLSPYPALVLSTYGKGRVAYFSEAIGHFFEITGIISVEERIGRMIKDLNSPSMLEVDAPKNVGVELYRQKEPPRIIIHLVNNTVDRRPVSEFIPVKDIALTLCLAQEPKGVFPLRENAFLESSYRDGHLHIKVPGLSLYEVIVVVQQVRF